MKPKDELFFDKSKDAVIALFYKKPMWMTT